MSYINPNNSRNNAVLTSPISEETSKRITALRFLLIVLVVFIHNNYTVESIAEGPDEILFVENAFGRWVQLFISQGIARCAVPLFFLFAAYLQAKKSAPYKTLLKKRSRSLLVPYILWTVIYAFYFAFLKLLIAKIAPQLLGRPDDTCLSWTALDWFHKLIGYEPDGKGGFHLPGFAYHFWFIRDLMILILISPIIKFLIHKFPSGFFMLLCVILFLPVKIYFVADQALFFYSLGLYWGMYDFALFGKIDKISWNEALVLFAFVFALTYFPNGIFSEKNEHSYLYTVLISCIIFLKLSKKIVNNEKVFKVAEYLAGFSFFLFAVHAPVLNVMLQKLWIRTFPMKNTFFALFEYFGVNILTVALGTGIGIALKKICPPLFALLNGGRK